VGLLTVLKVMKEMEDVLKEMQDQEQHLHVEPAQVA